MIHMLKADGIFFLPIYIVVDGKNGFPGGCVVEV